ncbi:hypothetical protein HPB48_010401 [Haemaphysalis longicornis]|uniref:HTH CENPB-type domain-containing protein n=1 Tax=Haemaphysalis longicornis TaxID=44386 RepID=A0A9J6GWD1_HAELO|nr:hypothetical protein HPB48_010401 [Haemaphysalis longicornis]
MGRRFRSFTAAFTLQVIEYAEEHGKREAGCKFDMDEKRVRYWIKQKDALATTNRSRKAFRGKKCKYPELEGKLFKYVVDTRRDGYAISTDMIRVKALNIARHMEMPQAQFKANRGWVTRFMNRNQLSICRRTTLCQKLPSEYESHVIKFHCFVNGLTREHQYDLSQIGNANQTPVWFDAPESTTVDFKGLKSVSVRTTGAERQRSVMPHGRRQKTRHTI